MQSIPIIFIHKGDSFYLKYALRNAKKFNPNSRIILIGDKVTKYPDFVEYHNLNNYFKSASEFRDYYKHMSIVPEEIERFCFERWLILNEFLKKSEVKKCLTLDSDVLLFENASNGIKKFNKFDFTLANKGSGGFMYINNPKAISKLAEFILDFYKNKKSFDFLEKRFIEIKKINGGGINDIIILREFYNSKIAKVGDLEKIIDNSTYDNGILHSEGFEMKNNMKRIYFENKIPYGKIKNGKKIRFCCLHCQGPTKFYMKYFFKGKNPSIGKVKIKIISFLRDYLAPKLPRDIITFSKKILGILGF